MRPKPGAKTYLLLFLSGLAISVLSIAINSNNEKNPEIPSIRSFVNNDTQPDFPEFYESPESDSSKKTEGTYQLAVSGRGDYAQVEFLPDRLKRSATLSASVVIHRLRLILFPFHVFD